MASELPHGMNSVAVTSTREATSAPTTSAEPVPTSAEASSTPKLTSAAKKKLKKLKKRGRFAALPRDILLRIIRIFAEPEDGPNITDNVSYLTSLASVNCYMRELTAPLRWKVVCLPNHTNGSLQYFTREILSHHGQHITHLMLDQSFGNCGAGNTAASLNQMRAAVKLCGLDAERLAYKDDKTQEQKDRSCRAYQYSAIIQRCPHLYAVDLAFATDSRGGFQYLCKTLRNAATTIRDLTLSSDMPCTRAELGALLAPFSQLDRLQCTFERIDQHTSPPPIYLHALTSMHQLTSLMLLSTHLLSDELARADWSKVPLKSLSVSVYERTQQPFTTTSLAILLNQVSSTLDDLVIAGVPSEKTVGISYWTPQQGNVKTGPCRSQPLNLPKLKTFDFICVENDDAMDILEALAKSPIQKPTIRQMGEPLDDSRLLWVLKRWRRTLKSLTRTGLPEGYVRDKLGLPVIVDRGGNRHRNYLEDLPSSSEESASEEDDDDDSEGESEAEEEEALPELSDLSRPAVEEKVDLQKEEDPEAARMLELQDQLAMLGDGTVPGDVFWSVAEFRRRCNLD